MTPANNEFPTAPPITPAVPTASFDPPELSAAAGSVSTVLRVPGENDPAEPPVASGNTEGTGSPVTTSGGSESGPEQPVSEDVTANPEYVSNTVIGLDPTPTEDTSPPEPTPPSSQRASTPSSSTSQSSHTAEPTAPTASVTPPVEASGPPVTSCVCPPPSIRELRSQAKPDESIPAGTATVWTTDAGNYLEPRLGARGAELVELFRRYEQMHNIPTKKVRNNSSFHMHC
jgi:hypothetical protein